MVITPNRPRQRVSPSPTGNNSALHVANGEITAARVSGIAKYSNQKEQPQYSFTVSSQEPIENYSPKWNSTSRNQCRRHWGTCYQRSMIFFLIFIVLVTAALSAFIRTEPMFMSSISLEGPSRSLTGNRYDSIDSENIGLESIDTDVVDQIDISDNPHPRIVWLMSFPNRYVKLCIGLT